MTRPKTILIVDDDAPTQRLLEALVRRSGYTTVIRENGADAIATLTEHDVDVIILDLMMPRVSGTEVIDYLVQRGSSPPVIVCTAAGPKATAAFDERVVKAVIRKPFDIAQLVTTVEALAGPQEVDEARVLIIDDDIRSRYVMRAFLAPTPAVEAERSDDALELIRKERPHAILLDLMMPGTPGEALLRQLRANPETSDIPIIIVTSRSLGESERDELLRHAAGIIYKGDLSRDVLRGLLTVLLSGKE